MEISLQSEGGLKIKGKHSSLGVNFLDKNSPSSAVLVLGVAQSQLKVSQGSVIIDGPGEYEVGGIKIVGSRSDDTVVYQMTVDGIDILLGTVSALQKAQTKLKESHIVVVDANSVEDAAFITSFSPRAVLFFGDKSAETIKTFEKEGVQELAKYQTTLEKLPAEMETILLK